MTLNTITTYQAGVAQATVHRKLQKICDDILAPYGITKMQWFIIGTVRDAGQDGIRMSDLAEQLGTTMPYLTTATNLLVSRNILIRRNSTKDTRSRLVEVNQGYLKKCDEIEAAMRAGLRKTIYAAINPAEFKVYIKVMHQLASVDER